MRFSVDGAVMEATFNSAVVVFFFFFHDFVPDSSDFILDAGGPSGVVFAGSGGLFGVGCYFEFNHVSNLFLHCVFLIAMIEGRLFSSKDLIFLICMQEDLNPDFSY